MFKNPLKYQSGGAAPSQEEQKMLAAFIQWLPTRVKEFQGMKPNTIAQTIDGMSKTPEGKKQLQRLILQFQQEMQDKSQAFKKGGKIRDFICKHARGGKVDCGCKQEGGSVEKHQDVNGKIGVTNGKYQASDWENEFNQFTPTPGGGYARNYRLPMFGGHRWGIPGNTLRQVLVTYGDNGIPRKAVRDLKGYYGNGQIDTVIYDAYGNRHNSPEFEARVNRELEGMDPHQRPTKKENGGNVEKAQEGKGQLGRTYKRNNPDKYAEEGVDPNTLVEWSPVLVAYPDGSSSTVRSSFKDDMHPYYLRLKYNNPERFTQDEINSNLNDAREISEKNRGKGWTYKVSDFSYDPLREYGVHYKQQDLLPNGMPWSWEPGINTMYTWPWQPKGAADTVLVGYPVKRTLGRERVSNREPGFEAARDKWFEMINHPKTESEWESPWRFRDERKLKSSKSLKEERNKSKASKNENGGKIEKAQDGSILDYYSNKWSNDLARIKSGWNRFKESTPGKVWGAFMPNPNSETGMLGAAAPIGKIKVIPEGKIGSLRRANYDPFVWEVVAKDPVVIENAKNLGLKEGSKEWAEFIEKTARDMDNLAKGIDFLSFKKGGIIQKNQNGSSSLGNFYRNKWKNDFFD